MLRGEGGRRIALIPSGDDDFLGLGGTVRFTVAPSGEVDGFTVSVARARNVRFDRVGPDQ